MDPNRTRSPFSLLNGAKSAIEVRSCLHKGRSDWAPPSADFWSEVSWNECWRAVLGFMWVEIIFGCVVEIVHVKSGLFVRLMWKIRWDFQFEYRLEVRVWAALLSLRIRYFGCGHSTVVFCVEIFVLNWGIETTLSSAVVPNWWWQDLCLVHGLYTGGPRFNCRIFKKK